MDSKNKFWRGVMVGVLVTALVCLITVGASAGIYMFGRRVIDNQTQVQVQTEGTPSQAQEPVNFENVTKKLEQIQDIIDKKYLFEEKIDTSEEEAGIYQGFLSGLNDPYAVYYTPDELTSFLDETNGSYCGIGALVSQNVQTGVSTIVRVFEGSPAEEAGILPGDALYKVDGTEVIGMDLSLLVNNYVKGEEGSQLTITVYRENSDEYKDITLTRRPIDVQTVSGKMLDEEIGYISVAEFDRVTADQFKSKIEELQGEGMKRLIIDLRNNPGGDLKQRVSFCSCGCPCLVSSIRSSIKWTRFCVRTPFSSGIFRSPLSSQAYGSSVYAFLTSFHTASGSSRRSGRQEPMATKHLPRSSSSSSG